MVLALIGALAACSSFQSNQEALEEPTRAGTKSRFQSDQDAIRTRTEGSIFGALIGGGLGALIGQSGRGAAIGVGAGSVVGLVYGDHVAKRKARYKKEEDWLDACIISARREQHEVQRFNAKLQAEVKRLKTRPAEDLEHTKKRVAELESDSSRHLKSIEKEIENQRYAQSKGTLTKNLHVISVAIAGLEKARGDLKAQQVLLAMVIGADSRKSDEFRGGDNQPSQGTDDANLRSVPDPDQVKRDRDLNEAPKVKGRAS